MGIISVNRELIFVGVGSEIWWRNINKQSFNKICVTHNLTNSKNSFVKDVVVSEDGFYLAVLTSNKYVLVYKSPDYVLHSSHQLSRAASKINFSKDPQFLLVADKTGDALIIDIHDSEHQENKILGHLSLLTDILMTSNGKFIITSDRDEKIRVSNYPKTYNIESFCLGHKEFVTSIRLLPHDEKYLLSTSGDGTVKIWDYLTGQEVHSLNVNSFIDNKNLVLDFQKTMKEEDIDVYCLPINNSCCCLKSDNSSLLAVSLHMHNAIFVFEISNTFDFKLIDTILINKQPISIALTPNDIWVLLMGESSNLDHWILKESKYVLDSSEVTENNHAELNDQNDVKLFYKRKFDNLQEYHNKKKQRLGIH